jgi:hypothetical protein
MPALSLFAPTFGGSAGRWQEAGTQAQDCAFSEEMLNARQASEKGL